MLQSERFVDCSPRQVWAALLDDGKYVCSVRTMYRILSKHNQVRERRNQRRHPEYTRPELLASAPNEVWSWDITKLKGPAKGSHFSLYVIIDIFSRCVVGWTIAEREDADLARELIEQTCIKHAISKDKLCIHADRGSAMTSGTVTQLLVGLGVKKSHSRPHVSNDNPYSEAQFKTLKYRPSFPERFGCLEDARHFCDEFFRWYNLEHYHTGIALLTPSDVHLGKGDIVIARRQRVLDEAFMKSPHRFSGGHPRHPVLQKHVWINAPVNVAASVLGEVSS